MNGVDRNQAMAALLAAMTALFVLSGMAPSVRWRRNLRRAAVVGYAIAAGAALIGVILWLLGTDR